MGQRLPLGSSTVKNMVAKFVQNARPNVGIPDILFRKFVFGKFLLQALNFQEQAIHKITIKQYQLVIFSCIVKQCWSRYLYLIAAHLCQTAQFKSMSAMSSLVDHNSLVSK